MSVSHMLGNLVNRDSEGYFVPLRENRTKSAVLEQWAVDLETCEFLPMESASSESAWL